MKEPLLIDQPDTLAAFVRDAHSAPWLGLDTEFVRDRQYYPQPGLIQVATPDCNALIDPVAITDLTPLAELLCTTSMVKILHAARQDLELFVMLFDRVPAPLYDTQIAATMTDLAAQIGYSALVEELLSIAPGVSLGRYNWLRRPLTAEAVAYAADDVEHLARLRELLDERLVEAGKTNAFAATMREMEDANRYRPQPETVWKRIRQARRLGEAARLRLQRLAAWRERQAMSENRPRQWVLRDGVLVTLARLAPSNFKDLDEVNDLSANARRRYGQSLLETLAAEGGDDS
ncbi:MAG: HRDC domain-containing protein [Gammaproteobacteria bacterium]